MLATSVIFPLEQWMEVYTSSIQMTESTLLISTKINIACIYIYMCVYIHKTTASMSLNLSKFKVWCVSLLRFDLPNWIALLLIRLKTSTWDIQIDVKRMHPQYCILSPHTKQMVVSKRWFASVKIKMRKYTV